MTMLFIDNSRITVFIDNSRQIDKKLLPSRVIVCYQFVLITNRVNQKA